MKFFKTKSKEFYRYWKCKHKLEISEEIFEYFLEVLPPAYMKGNTIGFADGEDMTDLWTENGKYYLQQRLHDNERLNENGNLVECYFNPYIDRYVFDFQRCNTKDGWAQFDTEEDASYFGIWVHKEKMKITQYIEGDIFKTRCHSPESFNAEIADLCDFYKILKQDRKQFFI